MPKTASFLERIAESFAAAGVRYCQWKGHWKRARWIAGQGDADLLVAPESLSQMLEILHRAGFRATAAPEDHRYPGTWHYRAPDPDNGQLLHIHVHTRLLIEAARGTTYRLPVEEALLASTRPGDLFPTPAPELEALVLVLRTTVRWASWRRVPTETRKELGHLERQTDADAVLAALARHLPAVDPETYRRCRRALERKATWRDRWVARRGLTQSLAAFSRPPTVPERIAHAAAAAAWHLRGGPRPYSRAQLTTGGSIVALVGADGAGKSTCARALHTWLAPHVATRAFHMGRAPRSMLTLIVGAGLKLARGLGVLARPLAETLQLLRHVCSGRDRWLLARTVATEALSGAICIVERYPIPLQRQLVGPWIPELFEGNPPAGLPRFLASLEERYYRRIPSPDVVIVLQVAPEDAVRRKTDEPADYVRARANIVWELDWKQSGAHVIDASRPLPAVLADLQTLLWSAV